MRHGGGDATFAAVTGVFPLRQSDSRSAKPGRTAHGGVIKAVLGPTNTGKTHLAIERLCAHSSGAIGFPLRLLAREVYDRVCAIKGPSNVALITGEERIEPPDARWLLCTAEAMPRQLRSGGTDLAFVALDEAQLAADRERGHVFTDRLLNARGREETMLLGAATLEPLVRALVPEAEIADRPRFSTLRHAGAHKLSRLPPRSAIVAFSAEQVYGVAEMLRRFRGGAAVVMGALSPETRNRQVALFQSGEVDYIVATDAIGMGLNLDVTHVAFAGLSKFDGVRQRRLHPAEMAQIAGRAGRHQRDGSFGTLSGQTSTRGSSDVAFTDEEIYAIEEHRFAPLTRLYWRDSAPRFDSLTTLIDDLERTPDSQQLAAAPQATDLAVLKLLADDPALVGEVAGPGRVRRFWEACSLPDFRQHGIEHHARFVARLWQDLRGGYLGADFVATRIAELDNPQGDIDTLQGRIAAIRSWAYIAQRPDWVLARDEMAARARAVEARLSDALHQRLTERFVNRRTTVLMRTLGQDPAILPVTVTEAGAVEVDGEAIGRLEGFRFTVDHLAGHADRKLLLAAAERHLPELLAKAANQLVTEELGKLDIGDHHIMWHGQPIARLETGPSKANRRIVLGKDLALLDARARAMLQTALDRWLTQELGPLAPLRALEVGARDPLAGAEVRALLLKLIDGDGVIARAGSGLERIEREKRPFLRSLGVTIGALDIFIAALLKPRASALLAAIGAPPAFSSGMPPVAVREGAAPFGYRRAGRQMIRVDLADKLLQAAYRARAAARGKRFAIDPALAVSTGLTTPSFASLLREAGFKVHLPRRLPEGGVGPAAPPLWSWRPPRRAALPGQRTSRPASGAFAALAELAL